MGNSELTHPLVRGKNDRKAMNGGRKMKHFQTAEWSDFVNHLASDNRRKALQGHRGTRRNRHIETGVEASYQRPAQGVRIVKAAFALAAWKSKSPETYELMQLEYDSLSQLAPPGTRSVT